MRLQNRASATLGLLALLAIHTSTRIALATTEPPTVHDARALGMGSTAMAHVHNGAAIFHNVAALHEVGTLTATANLALTHVGQSAPLMPGSDSAESDAQWVPLFLLGGAYRLNDSIVAGLAAYATGGFGAEYDLGPGGKLKLTLGALEVAPAVEVSLSRRFSLGIAYRITYMAQTGTLPGAAPGSPALDIDLSGTNFAGLHLSAYYRPIDRLKLGFAYRSKVTTELEGTGTSGGMDFDVASEFAFPHAFRAGLAYEVIEDELLIALDLRYLLHSEANESTTLTTPAGDSVQTLDWNDAFSLGVGAEYFVIPLLPLRAGYMITSSATSDQHPGPFVPPPGALHSVHFGTGLKLAVFDFDVGGDYSWGRAELDEVAMDALPGKYSLDTLSLAASVTYRH